MSENHAHLRPGVPSYPRRFPQPPIQTLINLGPIALLSGSWTGTGFNVIWRPDNTGDPHFKVRRFLQLNMTSETLVFDTIPTPIPNRGVANQPDITIYGLHYLQKVRDNDTNIPNFPNAGEDLHIEPGLFLNVPQSGGVANSNDAAANVPVTPANIVRMASIPHGVNVRMQGVIPSTNPILGPLTIPPIYPIADIEAAYTNYTNYSAAQGTAFATQYASYPAADLELGIQPTNVPTQALAQQAAAVPNPTFHAVPENTIANDIPYPNAMNAQSNGPFPAAWQAFVNDPNVILRNALIGQDILGFIPITLTTPSPAAISQIPFLGIADPALEATPTDIPAGQSNAFVHSATSTFWIEWVKSDNHHHGPHLALHDPALKLFDPFPGVANFLQLQYTQTVILDFNEVLWPHISVATLRLQF